jgi:excisionase family DNA binding protein
MAKIKRRNKKPPTVEIPNKEFMDIKQAAAYLELSRSYLYKMTQNKEIMHIRTLPNGLGKILFRKTDLDLWMARKLVAPVN